MPIVTTAIAHFVIVLVIGIVAGLVLNRYGQGWIGRKLASSHSATTSALVGIAGAFIGFHIAVILGLLPTPLMLYLGAAVGALIVVWLWRGR